MRDYSHDTNWKDKPKWKRFLINLKWQYVKADRKLHGRLTFLLMISVVFAVLIVLTRTPQPMDPEIAEFSKRLEELRICYKGCTFPI